ncbi:hypothetical protein [Variovorax sp. RA8]|uniref:hypothetical protein n=1 Tax=Variovorax sp. (strain JCM 16519 / RA8) TaxID=662548 RepID=UPI0013170315|nr:hypothetical protein [Variovorax sp. RA8]VTU34294.1 hypothetical protein RA8CHR_04944 [Variovorax sp. RA8]
MSAAATISPGVEYEAGTSGDIYIGRPAALIAAGLIEAAKVPGAPGMPRSSITFVDGVPQPRGAKPAHDERWMQATMYGRQLRLTKGIDPEERSRREQKRARELEELARTTPKKDIGRDEAIKQLRSASAIFQVGDSVIVNGHQAMVCEGYKVHTVRAEDGEYIDRDGVRVEHRWGYTCRYRSGEEFFFAAYQVTAPNDTGRPSHLRLVAGAKPAPRPVLALRSHA